MEKKKTKLLSGLAGLIAGIGLVFNPASCRNLNYNNHNEKGQTSETENQYNTKKTKKELEKIQKNNPNISRDLALTLLLISQIPLEEQKPKTPEEIKEEEWLQQRIDIVTSREREYIDKILNEIGCAFYTRKGATAFKLEIARDILALQLTDPYKNAASEYDKGEIKINLAKRRVKISTIAERCGIDPDIEKYMDIIKTWRKDCTTGLNKAIGVIPPGNEFYYLIEGCSGDIFESEIERRKDALLDRAEGEDLDSLVGHYYGDDFHRWLDRCQVVESGNESYRTAKCLTRAAHNCIGECPEIMADPEDNYNLTEDEVADLLNKIKTEQPFAPREVICTLFVMSNYALINQTENINRQNPDLMYEDLAVSAYQDCLNEQG